LRSGDWRASTGDLCLTCGACAGDCPVNGAFLAAIGVEMEKKREGRREKKSGRCPGAEDLSELGMIRDRLLAQDPEGESLDSFLGSLRKTLGERPDLAAGLVESLSRNPSTVGFRTFGVLRDLFKDKAYRRVVKQAAYRFSQKGFVGDAEPSPVQTVVLIPKEVKKGVAHFLICDSAFWFVTALLPDEQYVAPTLLSAFVGEEGFNRIHVTASEGSNRFYREFLQHAESEFAARPCEVPVWHAANLFFEMLDISKSAERSKELEIAKRLLKPYQDTARPSLAFELLPELQQPLERMSEADVGELLRNLSLLWYLVPRKEVEPYWEKIQQLENPVLVIPKEIQQERTMEMLKRAAGELFVGERRRRYQRFFEEEALWFKLSGQEDLARWSWIVAHQLKSEMDAGEMFVAFQLVLVSMKAHWPREFETTGGGEADAEKRTESGLIML